MIAWTDYATGDHRAPCPECDRGERDKALSVTIEPGGTGVAHCFRCGYVETWREQREWPGKARARPVARPQPAAAPSGFSEFARRLWAECRPLAASDAQAYLLARGCALPPADGDARSHPALRHPSRYVGPALVALVTDVRTREPLSLHRTWIRADGTKADADPPRLLLRGHRKAGACIRLWPDEAVTLGLGIAEGIETALTLAHARAPVWAAIDAGNLGGFPLLAGLEVLTIAADHDDAGMRAANECAQRWADAGRDVRVIVPPAPGSDLNDVAQEAAA